MPGTVSFIKQVLPRETVVYGGAYAIIDRQGWELRLGVNCLGTWLFTQLLTPTVVSAAKASPPNSVRVVWVLSSAAEAVDPKKFVEGLPRNNQPAANDEYENRGSFLVYSLSKLGGYYYAAEYAARHKKDGVVSVSLNPRNLDTDFWREHGAITTCVLRKTLLYPPKMGAYTVFFAALSPDATIDKSGRFIAPWGQFWEVSKDLVDATRPKSKNGTGKHPIFGLGLRRSFAFVSKFNTLSDRVYDTLSGVDTVQRIIGAERLVNVDMRAAARGSTIVPLTPPAGVHTTYGKPSGTVPSALCSRWCSASLKASGSDDSRYYTREGGDGGHAKAVCVRVGDHFAPRPQVRRDMVHELLPVRAVPLV
ncbi:hypothetical protein F4801DRAFT_599143 [Xylaria longipes]|nr:hypothetical protein F4801DRAFT_599143 [Xylaria longipes]